MIEKIIEIAEFAGNIIMSHYNDININVNYKNDNSPVTSADIASNEYIKKELSSNFTYPVLTEENYISYNERKTWEKYWIVDPLDGTKDFIEKNDEFTVNIALVEAQRPILGVINAPALGLSYSSKIHEGAYKNGEKIFNTSKRESLIGVDSRCHSTKGTLDFFKNNNINEVKKIGSSLKLCRLAEGEVDIYPRINGTKEWDTAAADIILSESGCSLLSYPDRNKLLYNKKSLVNPFFIAFKDGCIWR